MSKTFRSDFFGEEYAEKKAGKLEFFRKYSKHRFLPHLRIPTEYVVILAIGVLLLMIVVYAIGVESGKRFQVVKVVENVAPRSQIVVNKGLNATTPVGVAEPKKEVQKPEKVVRKRVVEKKEETSLYDITGYIVQLASFRKEDLAEDEVQKLKRKGLKAAYSKSGSWYQVYVSGYRKMRDAVRAKNELAKNYKDCYIRKID